MQTKRTPLYDRSLRLVTVLAFSLCFCSGIRAQAQTGTPVSEAPLPSGPSASPSEALSISDSSSADAALPDAPSAQQAADPSKPAAGPGHKAPKHPSASTPVISPGEIAPSQTVGDKFVLSLRNSISPFSLAGDVISAGYSHLTNGSPNYGTDGNAFAQRFGAAVARGSSQSIFSAGVMAPILHEDPRYYQLGRGHSIVNRGVYAATRVLVTRRDDGRKTPNLSLLSGYLGSAILTETYYPPKNTSFTEIASTYGSSLGGAALGNLVTEFLSDTLQIVHLRKSE